MKKSIIFALTILIIISSCSIAIAAEQSIAVGSIITFGRYEQDGNKYNGDEPIQWEILAIEDSKAMLVSVNGLEAVSYSEPMDVAAYDDKNLSWETSYLRSWLNNDFFNMAFTNEEKKRIANTKVENDDAFGSYTTYDALFCLSISEADKYFGNSVSMACGATAEAKKRLKADQGAISEEGYCNWWLRDMTSAAKSQSGYNFMSTKSNEVGFICGDIGTTPAKSGSGIPVFVDYLCTARPAMWIEYISNVTAATINE